MIGRPLTVSVGRVKESSEVGKFATAARAAGGPPQTLPLSNTSEPVASGFA